ncbi:hypothetical protein FNV58_01095 (plasmid) [Streptomyces sp. RLB1-9]|uniref:hypothetical protein n=1 Tax=Streptomyces sp. RLB1-9 TaxID=2594454 RepID=UPI0011622DDB|nr:hypothetical protein [Streptomyces sp. RLB1-9]QDN94957.1 hypothetical protein FNV58_01095 [Streptomyces sp. RLB1-9]
MTKSSRPQADPPALAAAAETLQAAAARLLAAGVPLADVTALAEAARDYAAEHAAATVARLDRSIGLLSPSPLSTKPIDAVRATALPLIPAADHEHVWVTALDGDDEPARDADGNTWTHCGVCGDPRDGAPRPVFLSTPCARPDCEHTLNWHTGTGGHGCIARGGACSCPAFAQADTDAHHQALNDGRPNASERGVHYDIEEGRPDGYPVWRIVRHLGRNAREVTAYRHPTAADIVASALNTAARHED